MNSQEKLKENGGGGRVCYFLVCYNSIEFVAFLLASLFRTQDIFFVHCDKKASPKLKIYLDKVSKAHPNIILLRSQDYSWAGYSHVDISLKAIATAMAYPHAWQHFIFLSEQHLPLKTPDEIAAYLRPLKSLVALRCAAEMTGDEQADIRNRFAARYRELPGVGCFATGLMQRDEDFFRTIFHGSNWMVLHRRHCSALLEADARGRFDLFRNVVHAEETAMQSILAPLREEIENNDPTLVAWPHMTDNPSLVMSENLFKSAITTNYLFIRKRTEILSPFVRDFVTRNHFSPGLYASASGSVREMPLHLQRAIIAFMREKVTGLHIARLARFFRRELAEPVIFHRIDPRNPFTPRLHLVLQTPSMRKGLSVRLLSENLVDFKICVVGEPKGERAFKAPYIVGGNLHSTIRAKIHLLYGYEDILPLEIDDAGFVSLKSKLRTMPVAIAAAQFLRSAATISQPQPSDAVAEGANAG
jgi:hypothetical protein